VRAAAPALVAFCALLAGPARGADESTASLESRPIGPPTPAAAPSAAPPSTFRTIGSLGVVVGLIVAAGVSVRLLARAGMGRTLGAAAGSPSGVVDVLARYPAGRGLTLVILKVDRRVLLLGQIASTTGRVGSVSTLTAFDDADEVASLLMKTQDEQGHSLSAKFRETFAAFCTGHADAASAGADDTDAARAVTRSADGDEVALVDEHAAGVSLGAFRRTVSALRTGGAA
jgi:flagellar biogenesis protein FliO